VDIAVPQGPAFQHPELVEQKQSMVTGAIKVPVPCRAFLIAMGRADRGIHVQHDILQPVAVMKPVDPLAVQIGQRRSVLSQGERLGLEPPNLRGRCRLRIDGTATNDLAHDRIEG